MFGQIIANQPIALPNGGKRCPPVFSLQIISRFEPGVNVKAGQSFETIMTYAILQCEINAAVIARGGFREYN